MGRVQRIWWRADGTPPPQGWRASDRLGDVLLARGLITAEQLDWALEAQRRSGSRLGTVLVAAGVVRRLDIGRTLAEQWGIEFADLSRTPLDVNLARQVPARQIADEGWMPVRAGRDEVLVATVEEPTEALAAHVRAVMGRTAIRFAATTDWDLAQGLHRTYGDVILDSAAYGLDEAAPHQSARRVLTARQGAILLGAIVATIAGFVVWPWGTAVVIAGIVNAGYAASIAFKFVVSLAGARHEQRQPVTAADVAALADASLPTYTVLVPVYREANIIGQLLENLGDLDYPPEKLEILLLLEADDTETIEAARAASPTETVQFVIVPPGGPQTKPKACNVGLFFARGDLLVIYDAEDRPEPDQLRKVVAAFRAGDERLVCVQAALNYFNADENVLTRMFTLEYSYWFDYMLPGLDALHLPIPLGGTSNHFRTGVLRALGGWDPFNVTEDADLGIRAAAEGYTVGVVNSTTFEEANTRVGNWVRQRSRWIKGYLQTALVHLRHPARLVRTAGLVPSLAFAVLVAGTPLTFLCGPPLWAIFVWWLVTRSTLVLEIFPPIVLYLSFFNLLVGNGVMIYLSMMGAFKRRRYGLVLWSLLNPVYWILHSIAAYKAAWQLVFKPHYWEKTEHGISRHVESPAGDSAVTAAASLAS